MMQVGAKTLLRRLSGSYPQVKACYAPQNLYTELVSTSMLEGWISTQTRGMKAAPKQMEIILTADIDKLGKAGEIVKVAKGYARNMLIPQLLALPKLDKYVDLVRRQLEVVKMDHPEVETVEEVVEAKTEEQSLKELNVILNRLDTQRLVVRRHTPRKSSSLRKHITPEDLVAEVKKQQNIQLEEINLEMTSVIDALGEYEIPLRLPRSVQIPGGKAKIFLKVKVRRA
ncbi:hypothetical protein KP509_21G021200 [Ceratopteris richardii]|uniref:Large ribosomal subunit protein bL9c n=2 Tax=Ceratopteris richardii TaxID=49495 RepID=A0A8T2SAT7_CERRI|nr:hypothetical protein KP509_21G021200 [Ceratopteris richardii]